MRMPNFLIIGAGQSGSTSLYHYLGQHPQVFMSSVKEPMFFVAADRQVETPPTRMRRTKKKAVQSLQEYQSLFKGVRDEIAVGEASVQYFHSSWAPLKIKEYLPDVKMIVILRDPAERAYTSYLQMKKLGYEKAGRFSEAIDLELKQPSSGLSRWEKRSYIRTGFHHRFLERYYQVFDPDQIKVCFYDDLKTDPRGLLKELFFFLGVDETFVPDFSIRYNVKKISIHAGGRFFLNIYRSPLKKIINFFVPTRLRSRLQGAVEKRFLSDAPPLSPSDRARLVEVFRDDILKLQSLVQRDLSRWLQ